ncbi:MAG: kelch repeat-containing protein [Thermoplasmatota archaeon]
MLIVAFLLMVVLLPVLTVGSASGEEKEPSKSLGGGPVGDWEMLTSGSWPSISTGSCKIMYREAQKELVVFYRDDWGYQVWSLFESNESWVQWNDTGVEPSANLQRQAFTTSTDNDVAYYYGGWVGWGQPYGENLNIFFYSNKTWIQVPPPAGMTGRYDSAMVYDDATSSVWIFGGRDSNGFRNDLYQFNLTQGWTYHDPGDKPVGRDRALITITPDCNEIYMGLGRYRTQGWTNYFINDLWVYNVSRNNWTEITDDIGIPTEAGGILHYRPDASDLLLTLGYDGNTRLNDTYILDISNGSFTQVYLSGGISARQVAGFDTTSDGRTLLIFGDSDGQRDFWSVDVLSFTATLMAGNPTWTGGSAFTGYDNEDSGKLMALKHNDDDSWQLAYFSLDSGSWRMKDVSDQNKPTFHSGMASTYDPVDNDFYLYGGYYSYRVSQWETHYYFYDEFWKMDCDTGEWTRITEHALPGARGRAAMVMDPVDRMIYLYGGQVHGGDTDTLYRYNMTGNIWKAINPAIKPSSRMETSVVFNPNKKGFYMFGGRQNLSSNPRLNDLWFFHTDTQLWEKLPTGDDEPAAQALAGLSLNTDTNELMLFGDGDPETFLWRLEWYGWKSVVTEQSPGGWSGHGQAYSPQTKSHFAWAGEGTEVWEFNPILRTTAVQVQMFDPEGWTTGSDAVDVFPTLGKYTLKVRGRTDLSQDDFLGMNLMLESGTEVIELTWNKASNQITVENGKDWMVIDDGAELKFIEPQQWEFNLPMEFTYDMPHGDTVSAYATPITNIGYPEQAKRLNLFRLNSELDIVGYRFMTPIQPEPIVNGWLFGNTNLTVHSFKVSFSGFNDVYPRTGDFKVNFSNGVGDSVEWGYIYNTSVNLTVPIKGTDGKSSVFYLNITDDEGLISSASFNFRVDMAPPGVVIGAALRADDYDDTMLNVDDDPEMFLTWDNVIEAGSGLKGICYSLDKNTYPDQENLTTEFKSLYVGLEGFHRLYVWAVDNTSRVGPFTEILVVMDSHQIYFSDPQPDRKVNVTYGTFVVSITINDALSGVDLDSIYYQYTMPDKQLSEWIKYEAGGGNASSIRVSLTLDMVPEADNLVIWKARDMARNKERQSDPFVIHYNPNLKDPKVNLLTPVDSYQVEESVSLNWKGNYINPLNLTYELMIVLPDETEETYPLTGTTYNYFPKMPGTYHWYVVAIADGKRGTSQTRTFMFDPPFVEVSFKSTAKVTIGYDYPLSVSMKNTLEVNATLTFSLQVPRGFSIERGDTYDMIPGESLNENLILNSSQAQPGTYAITINVTDSYGRFNLAQVSLVVEKEVVIDGPDDDEEKDLPIGLIIGIIAGLLILVIIIILVVLKRRRTEKEEEEKEEEEEDISLEYDPTGKIAKGSGHVSSSVPLTPDILNANERELRMRGSNVIELTIPAKKEEESYDDLKVKPPEEEPEEDEMEELSEDEMAEELYGEGEE